MHACKDFRCGTVQGEEHPSKKMKVEKTTAKDL
jgi:hypothetical protein